MAIVLSVPAMAAQAQQVYKWVDADGRVQYSERKPTDAGTRHTEIKPPPPAQPVPPPPPPRPKPTPSKPLHPPVATPEAPKGPPVLSKGLNRETDAYRCALARDILSGSMVHSNGKPTDDYDRRTAQGDISSFCK
ncbi:DUF4124 domain-containing protein [Mitsuaria sp. GD03876]|uniref:DUF4124 domain-containing protein n=1 Tax=Mitsuaria sp. GD03876 TaxID=2975399 RepID=UPI00244D7983|nr:DUF4124 domain-containing protein [Mitsuaria sp. GD03876]MDH0863486.1 DUF4124 domain-containing protein [Mitsuaria sp. GD03876]